MKIKTNVKNTKQDPNLKFLGGRELRHLTTSGNNWRDLQVHRKCACVLSVLLTHTGENKSAV